MSQPASRPLRFFWLLGLLTLVASAAGAIWALNPPNTPATPPPAGPVTSLTCYGYVDVDGGVTILSPLQPGRVVWVAEENLYVNKAGVELLRLDDTLNVQRLDEAKADLRAAEEQVKQAHLLATQHDSKIAQQKEAINAAKQDIVTAQNIVSRIDQLVKKGQAKTQEDLDAARAQQEKARVMVRVEEEKLNELVKLKSQPELAVKRAEQDVAAKKARVAQAEYAVKECTIVSPGPGTVLQVNVTLGTVLGAQMTQPAIVFLPDKPYIIRAEVEQEFAKRVAKGKAVTVWEENSTTQAWDGKVARVAEWFAPRRSAQTDGPRVSNDVHTRECIVALDKKETPLRVGQRVRVIISKD